MLRQPPPSEPHGTPSMRVEGVGVDCRRVWTQRCTQPRPRRCIVGDGEHAGSSQCVRARICARARVHARSLAGGRVPTGSDSRHTLDARTRVRARGSVAGGAGYPICRDLQKSARHEALANDVQSRRVKPATDPSNSALSDGCTAPRGYAATRTRMHAAGGLAAAPCKRADERALRGFAPSPSVTWPRRRCAAQAPRRARGPSRAAPRSRRRLRCYCAARPRCGSHGRPAGERRPADLRGRMCAGVDWAHPSHICTGTRAQPLPHLRPFSPAIGSQPTPRTRSGKSAPRSPHRARPARPSDDRPVSCAAGRGRGGQTFLKSESGASAVVRPTCAGWVPRATCNKQRGRVTERGPGSAWLAGPSPFGRRRDGSDPPPSRARCTVEAEHPVRRNRAARTRGWNFRCALCLGVWRWKCCMLVAS